MSIELLTNNEFNEDIKKLLENEDLINVDIDIYSILVEKQVNIITG